VVYKTESCADGIPPAPPAPWLHVCVVLCALSAPVANTCRLHACVCAGPVCAWAGDSGVDAGGEVAAQHLCVCGRQAVFGLGGARLGWR
jgi:hypothetical protein